jgi:hypothetical protein
MSWFLHTLNKKGLECPKIFLETGTYLGEGVYLALKTNYFEKIYSIEIANEFYVLNKRQFENFSSVEILEGDSAKVIREMIENDRLEKKPTLFYLDAHFSGGRTGGKDIDNGCPLLRELEVIANRGVDGDVIVVDDMRLMGNAQWSGVEGCSTYPKTFFDFTHVDISKIIEVVAKSTSNIKNVFFTDDVDRLIIAM